MSDHDVRHALATFADATPFLDPREGLAERFARRARARRAAIAATACFAAVVAGTGVAALTRDRGTAAVVATDEVPSETPAASSPSPSPDESPSPSAEPGDDPAPATEPTSRPSGSAQPAPPGDPIVRTAGGPGGLRVKVTLAPGSLPTARTAALTVEAEDDDGQPQLVALSWGDGSSEMIAMVAVACASRRPPLIGTPSPRPPAPGELDRTYLHAWRQPGRYTVTAQVRSAVMCADDDPPVEEHTIRLDVVVTPGETTSNGPAKPQMEDLDWDTAPGADGAVQVTGRVTDDDGWVSAVTIDWGDGSTPTTIHDDDSCDDGDGRHYPQHGFAIVDRVHRYAESGAYRITVTATTTGCDGRDPQRKTVTLDAAA